MTLFKNLFICISPFNCQGRRFLVLKICKIFDTFESFIKDFIIPGQLPLGLSNIKEECEIDMYGVRYSQQTSFFWKTEEWSIPKITRNMYLID